VSEQITIEHLFIVLDYVGQHSSITNRECRIATGVGYDSSIKIFAAMCDLGILKRTGETSGSKYVPERENPSVEKITVGHLATVMNYAVKHGSVTNRQCQDTTGATHNGSIRILGALCSLRMLRKNGKASDTQYVVNIQTYGPLHPGYHRKERL
jgi:predicted HTH transcriptional regulator